MASSTRWSDILVTTRAIGETSNTVRRFSSLERSRAAIARRSALLLQLVIGPREIFCALGDQELELLLVLLQRCVDHIALGRFEGQRHEIGDGTCDELFPWLPSARPPDVFVANDPHHHAAHEDRCIEHGPDTVRGEIRLAEFSGARVEVGVGRRDAAPDRAPRNSRDTKQPSNYRLGCASLGCVRVGLLQCSAVRSRVKLPNTGALHAKHLSSHFSHHFERPRHVSSSEGRGTHQCRERAAMRVEKIFDLARGRSLFWIKAGSNEGDM